MTPFPYILIGIALIVGAWWVPPVVGMFAIVCGVFSIGIATGIMIKE